MNQRTKIATHDGKTVKTYSNGQLAGFYGTLTATSWSAAIAFYLSPYFMGSARVGDGNPRSTWPWTFRAVMFGTLTGCLAAWHGYHRYERGSQPVFSIIRGAGTWEYRRHRYPPYLQDED